MKILVTTDGSPCSDVALDHLLNDESLPRDCQFKVLSVVDAIVGAYPISECYIDSMVEAESALRADRTKLVESCVAKLKDKFPDATVEGSVSIGFPADRILGLAASWQADLIVLGSHSRHGFSHFVMGSVAERVARDAECSVEIIRIPKVATEKASSHGLTATKT